MPPVALGRLNATGNPLSNYFLTLAFFMPDIQSSRKFVLVALADAANDFGICYPSIAHIIEKTCLDRKTVIDAIGDLKELGFLKDTGERKGKTKQVPVFKLELTSSPKNGTVKNVTVPEMDGKSPVFPSKQSQKRDTEPLRTLIEPTGSFRKEKKDISYDSFLPSLDSQKHARINTFKTTGLWREEWGEKPLLS